MLDGLQLHNAMFPVQESASITPVPREHKWTEMTYASKLEMCVTSSILSLTALLCFKCVSKPCTQMNDPAKEFLHEAQWNGLCRANLICGFAQTILGFEQICYALGLGDEEEQHRGEWGFCEPLKICRPLAGFSKTWPRSPHRPNKKVNHYISAPNIQEVSNNTHQTVNPHHRYSTVVLPQIR